jgi:hypothetical protein
MGTNTFCLNFFTHRAGPHAAWSGNGSALPASSGAELCRSCVLPTHQLAWLLQSLAWLLWIWIVVHSSLIITLLLKLLYLILSLIFSCFIMKNSTPLHHLWLGGCAPPYKSTPDRFYLQNVKMNYSIICNKRIRSHWHSFTLWITNGKVVYRSCCLSSIIFIWWNLNLTKCVCFYSCWLQKRNKCDHHDTV